MFLKYKAEISFLEEILDKILEYGNKAGLESKKKFQLRLISEEILVNIINYSYPNGNGFIYLSFEIKDGELKVIIKNTGIKFNPLNKDLPDIDEDLDNRVPGGLGIFLAIQTADDISYEYKNNENVLSYTLVNDNEK